MNYSEQRELVDSLRAIADFYEAHIELPKPDITFDTWIAKYDKEWKRDQFEERREMRRIAKAVGSAEKEYDSYNFKLRKRFGKLSLVWMTSRDSVCTPKVVGTRIVPAIEAQPEREVDVVEWECTDSLLAPTN